MLFPRFRGSLNHERSQRYLHMTRKSDQRVLNISFDMLEIIYEGLNVRIARYGWATAQYLPLKCHLPPRAQRERRQLKVFAIWLLQVPHSLLKLGLLQLCCWNFVSWFLAGFVSSYIWRILSQIHSKKTTCCFRYIICSCSEWISTSRKRSTGLCNSVMKSCQAYVMTFPYVASPHFKTQASL